MVAEERDRREAYERVRASFALEGMQLTADEERDLEPYFRGKVSLEELTVRAVAVSTVTPLTDPRHQQERSP